MAVSNFTKSGTKSTSSITLDTAAAASNRIRKKVPAVQDPVLPVIQFGAAAAPYSDRQALKTILIRYIKKLSGSQFAKCLVWL
jgi:hypothetical protein